VVDVPRVVEVGIVLVTTEDQDLGRRQQHDVHREDLRVLRQDLPGHPALLSAR
jgi:hypothetical protein